MKELLLEFLDAILNENKTVSMEKQANGSVVPTRTGSGWRAKNMNGKLGWFNQNKKKEAEKWAKGTDDSAPKDNDTESDVQQTEPTTEPTSTQTGPSKGSRKRKTVAGGVELDPPVETTRGTKITAVVPFGQHTPPHEPIPSDLRDRSEQEAKRYSARSLPETNDEYYKRMIREGGKDAVRKPPIVFSRKVRATLKASGVPEHHIQVLERAVNTRLRSATLPKMSDVTGENVGAGKIRSQVGEIVALTLMAVQPKEQRDIVANELRSMVGDDKRTLLEAHGKNSWLGAGVRQADAFTAMMDNQYGEGNWTVEATAWDTPDDIAGIGLEKKNKGFSTDVALRVKVTGKDKAQVVRLSLKKDGKIFLLNGSTRDIVTFSLQALDEKDRVEITSITSSLETFKNKESSIEEKQKAKNELIKVLGLTPPISDAKLREAARLREEQLTQKALVELEKKDPNAARAVRTIVEFPEKQQNSAVKLGSALSGKSEKPLTSAEQKQARAHWNARRKASNINQEVNDEDFNSALKAHKALTTLQCAKKTCSNEEMIRALMKAGAMPKSNDLTANLDRFRKAVLYAAEIEAFRTPSLKTQIKSHKQLATDAGNAAIEATVRSPELKQGMMLKLQETFPIQVIATGEETMCLGGVPINKATLEAMFGTSDPKQIQEGLVVEENERGEKVLVFIAGTPGKRVPIATVKARQKGIGYDNGIGLEFAARREFECAAAIANTSTKPPMNSASNAEIVDKCKRGDFEDEGDFEETE
jgi:hypothetical protein